MKHTRALFARMPELARFRARLSAPDWPTPAEVAHARATLAKARTERQRELALRVSQA